MNPLLDLLRSIFRSRLGRILFIIHLALAGCAYALHLAADPSKVAAHGEPLFSQVIYFLNFPAILATGLITWPALYERSYENYGLVQWLAVGFIVLCVLAQWWLVGYIIERLMRWGDRFTP
jgi:hypothetical protein